MDAALAAAAAGSGCAVALVGEPGIGKSRLLAAARERARAAGMLVCSARGAELEREFPFGVVRQLAASSFADTTREERDSWFAGVARMAAPLFREDAIAEDTGGASYPRLHALYWLCANASRRRPLALVVDDAHLADEASIAFVGFLARRVGELPLALLLGMRSPDPEEAPELAGVLADPETVALTPAPLSESGAAALLREILGREPDPAFAHACRDATEGNPFLLGELAGEVRSGGVEPTADHAARVATLAPPGVRTNALVRLARLSEHARRVARTLALLGDHSQLAIVAELAGLDEAAALDAAVELEDAGFIAREDGLGFVHPLLRAAIRDDIASVERVAGHAAAARALARHGAEPDVVAVHLLRTEPAGDGWVVATLREGARRALALGDPEPAIAYLKRALDEPPDADARPAVLLELGSAEARTSVPDAIARLEQAFALATGPQARCAAALRLAQLLSLTGRAAEAAKVLDDGLAAAGGDAELADPLRAELIATAYVRLTARRRLDPLIRSLREPDGPPETPLELAATAALAVEHSVTRGDPERGAELALWAWANLTTVLGPIAAGQIHHPIVLALIAAEHFDQALRTVDAALTVARSQGSAMAVAVGSRARAAIRWRIDDLLGAEADALACLELLTGEAGGAAVATGAAAAAVLAGIELGRAPGDLERLLAAHEGDHDFPSHGTLLLAEGALAGVQGDNDRALDRFERCGEYEWARDCPAVHPWRSGAAGILARVGRADEARELAAAEVALARRAGRPRALGVALRVSAEVAAEDADREVPLEEAVALLERTEAPVELARALLGRGALRRRGGRRSVSRDDLQRAYDLASRRGAVRVAEAAAAELDSSGARLRRVVAAGADALTPSERRVAELAVGGLSNRDIAQSLFLSEKTVEAHLGRAYRKLGIRSRVRLAAALGGASA